MRQPCDYRSAEISHNIVNECTSYTEFTATRRIKPTRCTFDEQCTAAITIVWTVPERPRQTPPRDRIVQHTSFSSVSQLSQQTSPCLMCTLPTPFPCHRRRRVDGSGRGAWPGQQRNALRPVNRGVQIVKFDPRQSTEV